MKWWWNFYWNRREVWVGYYYDRPAGAHVIHAIPCVGFAWGRRAARRHTLSAPAAQPISAMKERPVCLYCAMDKGAVSPEERPLAYGRP